MDNGSDNGAENAGFADASDATAAEGFNGGLSGIGDASSPGFSLADMDFSGVPSQGFGMMGMGFGDMNDADFASIDAGINSPSLTADDEGFSGKLLSFLANKGIVAALNALGIPGTIASGVMGMGKSAATGDPSHAFNGVFNGLANMATMGGFGMAHGLNSALGLGITGTPSNANGPGPSSGVGGSGMDGDLAAGLGGVLSSLYQGNQANKAYGGAVGQLNDLFSPNSPYAQQMRQMMERKDAAAGRRSQYGPREAQLAALLSQQQAQSLTSPGYANLIKMQQQGKNAGLNNLLALMGKGGPLNGVVNQAGQGLMNLFGGSGGGVSFGPAPTMGGTDYGLGGNAPGMGDWTDSPSDLGGLWGG